MEIQKLAVSKPEEERVANRSFLYSLFSRGFRFPSQEQCESVKAGKFADEVQGAIGNLPYGGFQSLALGRGAGMSYEEFQGNFIALFEVGGAQGPPSFLYEGEFGGGRMKVMEEVLRFYHHFGLRISEEKRDRPDHLASELEFMHLLTFKDTEAVTQGKDRGAYLKAEQDFLRFHLGGFVAAVASRVGSRGIPFYSDLANLVDGFCQKDLAYLATA
jgi:DMSO reductase family type II enzyme chaperone